MNKKQIIYPLLFGIIVGLFIFFFQKEDHDIDTILVSKITALREEQDRFWLEYGKPIAESKSALYVQEKEFLETFVKIDDQIKSLMSKVDNVSILPAWTPAHELFYKESKIGRYTISQVSPAILPTAQAEGVSESTVLTSTYTNPSDLFYACLRSYGCYVTQKDTEHFKRNGYLATDIGTGQKNIPVHALDYLGNEVEYTVSYKNYPATTGNAVELTSEFNGVKFMWRIGHIHWDWEGISYKELEGKIVRTGDVIAISGGDVGRADQGATTGKHLHIEFLVWDGVKYVPTAYRTDSVEINKHQPSTTTSSVDMKRLAYAVAMHETGNCTKGYGKEYNNCFGIKNGNTAPCVKEGRNRMCIYNTPEESYDVFHIIWNRWYKTFPTPELAQRWSNDRADEWLNNVTYFYNNYNA